MNTIMSGHRSEHDIRDSYRIENDINQMRQRLKGENIRAVNDREYDYAIRHHLHRPRQRVARNWATTWLTSFKQDSGNRRNIFIIKKQIL
jgi:hypothetical protein